MTGVELLNRVKNEHPGAMRLIFTGYADIKAVIDAINQGNVFRYVTKPWDPEELVAALREAGARYDCIVRRNHLLAELRGLRGPVHRLQGRPALRPARLAHARRRGRGRAAARQRPAR